MTENRDASSSTKLSGLSVSRNFTMPVISSNLLLGDAPGSMALDKLGNLNIRGADNNVITFSSITAGTGISVTNGPGTITISNVATVLGTPNQITSTTVGSTTTLSLPQDVNVPRLLSTARLYSLGDVTSYTGTSANFTPNLVLSRLRKSGGIVVGAVPAAGPFQIIIDISQGTPTGVDIVTMAFFSSLNVNFNTGSLYYTFSGTTLNINGNSPAPGFPIEFSYLVVGTYFSP